jgi:outer membrane protein assembly factor BamB
MNPSNFPQRRHAVVLLAMLCSLAAKCLTADEVNTPSPPQAWARQVLDATGVRGGLVVHLGCGDGQRTAALRAGDAYLVQGLDADESNVRAAREFIQSQSLYGPVSVGALCGEKLPYVDNLVNLVVAEDSIHVTMDEILRVLCPDGVAYLKKDGQWQKTVKPRPGTIDQWTHYLYDATGNAVSQDLTVGPPRHFQWTGSPRWSRHHDRRASVSAMVSAGGRIFYIFDEGSTASILLPPRTKLIARDAFNGVILWKREIPEWFTHLWPFKSGPTQLQRRLVAIGDTVYATLGVDAPLTALDAETGETVREYEGTLATEEVLFDNGVLFLLVNPDPQSYDAFQPQEVGIGAERDRIMVEFPWNEEPRQLRAIEADSGNLLWTAEYPVAPLTPAVDSQGIYFHDGEKVIGLDRKTGKKLWSTEPVERQERIPTNITPTLVVYDGVVLYYGATRKLYGISAATGEVLWSEPHPRSGHFCPEDVLVAGGQVWGGAIAGGRDSGEFIGRDPKTGEVVSRFLPDIDIYFMHQRCYRSKATEQWLIPGWTGTEFVDFRNQHWITNHWVRSGCIYGVMPCNGLLYTTPHDCACYMQAKLYGFCALAPTGSSDDQPEREETPRLQTGPAYGTQATAAHDQIAGTVTLDGKPLPDAIVQFRSVETETAAAGTTDEQGQYRLNAGSGTYRIVVRSGSEEWPTYRKDAARSGSTSTLVSPDVRQAWQVQLDGRVSPPVVAEGKLFVAAVDGHTVHAFDAESGDRIWSYTVNGRVDSPPTVVAGRVLFGSADGHVYCLRASDGQLEWRFRAAPRDRRMVSFEQVESVWPVSGSVLVQNGVVTCVAGRSMFLDGGLRLLKLDVATGELLGERVLDERDPASGENLQKYVEVRNMPVGLPDVLSSDGQRLYMRSQVMDLEGNRSAASLVQAKGSDTDRAALQKGEEAHLFSPTGFLDDTWWHRSYWVYGRSFAEGAGGWPQAGKVAPSGRILTVDDTTVYGFGRKPFYYQWRTPLEYHLFASPKVPEIVREPADVQVGAAGKKPRMIPHPEYCWSRTVPLLVRAMVKAGDTLFIVGPPDVVDEEEAFRRIGDPEIERELAAQDAALAGRQGALLWAVSADTGKQLAELKLDNLPLFDGLIAANGALYLVTEDGTIICYRG